MLSDDHMGGIGDVLTASHTVFSRCMHNSYTTMRALTLLHLMIAFRMQNLTDLSFIQGAASSHDICHVQHQCFALFARLAGMYSEQPRGPRHRRSHDVLRRQILLRAEVS